MRPRPAPTVFSTRISSTPVTRILPMLLLMLGLGRVSALAKPPVSGDQVLTRIAFGSCASQDKDLSIFNQIAGQKPQLMILLGDNIYADTSDMGIMRAKYARLLGSPPVRHLIEGGCPVAATWDDHDYGANDAGSEYAMRDASRELFFEAWGEPKDSPRRAHAGVYTSYEFGSAERRVRVILLDTRYFRTTNVRQNQNPGGRSFYRQNEDAAATMLGEEQWRWLEGELRKPARVRLIGSSIQCLPDFRGIESWALIPRERERLLGLLRETKAGGVVILSGDVHWGELMRLALPGQPAVYEATSSGLTHVHGFALPNTTRIGQPFGKLNFGMILIDWEAPSPSLTLRIHGSDGAVALEQKIDLGELEKTTP